MLFLETQMKVGLLVSFTLKVSNIYPILILKSYSCVVTTDTWKKKS